MTHPEKRWPKTCERYAKDIPGSTEIGKAFFTIAKRAYNESMLERIPTLTDPVAKTMNRIEYNLTHRPIKRRRRRKRVSEHVGWELDVPQCNNRGT